jgi:MFS family permease
MRRVGRRWGFVTGAAVGTLGGATAAIGLLTTSFALFCLGTFLYGVFAGFAQLYRFAAADVAAADFKSRAVSLVLAAGVIASFLGPEVAKIGVDLVVSPQFLGAYILLMVTTLLAGIIVSLIDVPPLTQTEIAGVVRPMGAIMRQPAFIAALLAAMVSQAVMNLLMVATPIAMARFNHQFVDTALVIQWHGVCMFAPGFFTGSLIRRFGEIRIILAGLTLVLVSVVIALSGQTVLLMWMAMAVLGLGWNFAFTAGTTLLVGQPVRPTADRHRLRRDAVVRAPPSRWTNRAHKHYHCVITTRRRRPVSAVGSPCPSTCTPIGCPKPFPTCCAPAAPRR